MWGGQRVVALKVVAGLVRVLRPPAKAAANERQRPPPCYQPARMGRTIIEAAIAETGDVKNDGGWCLLASCPMDTSIGDVRLPEQVGIPARFDDGDCEG